MAITKLPARVQPAFNEVIVTDDIATTLQVSIVAPSPAETITLYHVNANGGADFDLKGFLSKMFYDAQVPVITPNFVPWVFRDQRLVVNYTIGSDATQYLALNGVRQIGESLDVINEVASPVLSDRAKSNPKRVIIPCYDGFPVGFSAVWRNEYSLDTSDAFIVTLDAEANVSYAFPVTGEGMIMWGDGQIESSHTTDYRTHTYTEGGIKTILFLPDDMNAVHDSGTNFVPALQQYWSRIRTVEQFSSKMSAVSFHHCFGLQSVNALWRASDFNPTRMFYACSSLSTVPDNFFDSVSVTGPKSWAETFYGCSQLTAIPAGFFTKASNALSFMGCFRQCSNLTSLPSGLFPTNTYTGSTVAVTYMCYGCSKLTSIPSDLFQPLGAKAVDFSDTFSYCSRLASIPAALFQYATAATNMDRTFTGCGALRIIPSGLLQSNAKLTSVILMFYQSSVNTVPGDLFDNCPDLVTVQSCFNQVELTSIPSGLFAKNKKITVFSSCFEAKSQSFLAAGTTPVTAEGYRLWERAGSPGYPATVSGPRCFYQQTGLSDYADIPSTWK